VTVISSTTDAEKLTMTMSAEFDAAPERVWDLWEDPRKLERWWGPPTFPATFTRHDFVVGGESRYHMTGPAGETPRGWWQMFVIDRTSRIEFANGLAGDDGEPAPGIEPMSGVVTFAPTATGTQMLVITHFVDTDQMELMLSMGMREGMAQAIGQVDGLLGETAR
jgi:uncharacterized protein YndB with AHSA1/START domain